MSGPSVRRFAGPLSGLVLIAVLAGACASSATPVPVGGSPAASVAESSIAANPPSAPTVESSNNPPLVAPLIGIFVTSLGQVLEVGNGKMLYVHAGDSATASTCLDACATAWPPLLIAAGTTVVGPPGAHRPFASITRPDGSVQVTYGGKPLYFWKNDVNPGDTTGQGINGFTVATP